MAKYLQGINGAFRGKVGPVVGCVLNGNPYMRSMARPRTGKVGAVEQNNRNKFATVHTWLQPLLSLLRVGFSNNPAKPAAYNAAKSYNLTHAMHDAAMVPELVKISMGELLLSDDLRLTYLENDKFILEWNPASLEGANRKDQVMVLAYHPESRTALYELHGSFRETGRQELEMIKDFLGKTVYLYAAFIAADRNSQSDSIYLGAVNC